VDEVSLTLKHKRKWFFEDIFVFFPQQAYNAGTVRGKGLEKLELLVKCD